MPGQEIATRLVAKLRSRGHIAYFAGGWVRDFLLSLPSDDIDIATSASVEEVTALFPKTIPVGVAFGIVIVVEEGHSFEVATFRKEKEYLDGRRPSSIEKASPEEDASRRDFTINGMFYDPIEKRLLDFVGGQEDLKKKIVRAIGDPLHRFLEDRLRMIRAVRYAVRFQFTIEPDTEQAIVTHAGALFPSVAIERVRQELEKLSRFADVTQGLKKLYALGLLTVIFPSLRTVSETEFHNRLSLLGRLPSDVPFILKLAYLFPDDSLEEHLQLCEYLKSPKSDKEPIVSLHKAKNLLSLPLEWQEKVSDYEWAHFYADRFSSLFLFLYKAPPFHQEKQKILAPYVTRILTKTPIVTASDLLALGCSPGPLVGALLREAEKLSIERKIEEKEELLSLLKRSLP